MVFSTASLVYELPHELPNDLRLKILGNKEILGKSQIWMDKCPVFLQKLNFGNSSPKTRKSRYQTLLYLSSFPRFLYFVPNILSIIAGTKFKLKLTILIFWTKFAQKGYFQSKTEKVNVTIEFCIFELV